MHVIKNLELRIGSGLVGAMAVVTSETAFLGERARIVGEVCMFTQKTGMDPWQVLCV